MRVVKIVLDSVQGGKGPGRGINRLILGRAVIIQACCIDMSNPAEISKPTNNRCRHR